MSTLTHTNTLTKNRAISSCSFFYLCFPSQEEEEEQKTFVVEEPPIALRLSQRRKIPPQQQNQVAHIEGKSNSETKQIYLRDSCLLRPLVTRGENTCPAEDDARPT